MVSSKLILCLLSACSISFVAGYLFKPSSPPTAKTSTSQIAHPIVQSPTVENESFLNDFEDQLPASFIELAEEFPELVLSQLQYNQLLQGMTIELLKTDPAAAADLLDRFTDENTLLGTQELVISIWSEEDPEQAIKWLEERKALYGEERYQGYYSYALNSLAMVEPDRAVQYFEALEPGDPARLAIMQGVSQGWGQSDPVTGFQWLEQIESQPDIEPYMVTQVYSDLMMGYMHLHREEAAATIAELESTQLKAELIKPLVLKYADSGFGDAATFIQNLEDPDIQRVAAAHFVEINAARYPSEMIDFAINNMDLDTGKQDFLKQAFLSLSYTDFDQAIQQYDRLEGQSKDAAMEAIALSMSHMKGPDGAAHWVASLNDQQDRDTGFAALAMNASYDTTKMFNSLSQIQDSKKQTATLKAIVAQIQPHKLFDIQRMLQSGNLAGVESNQVIEDINTRISDEYGDLLLPSGA
ncbi:MAG: hypothetical protein AAFX93_17130 [Verrucomicrobiota bacterium]